MSAGGGADAVHGSSWLMGSACRLEACDDLLLRIFRTFSVIGRLRLAGVSKRWQRLLLAELVFKEIDVEIVSRAPQIIRWAGDALIRLDFSALVYGLGVFVNDIMDVLCDSCPNLKTLVVWAPEQPAQRRPYSMETLIQLSAAQRLAAACPRASKKRRESRSRRTRSRTSSPSSTCSRGATSYTSRLQIPWTERIHHRWTTVSTGCRRSSRIPGRRPS